MKKEILIYSDNISLYGKYRNILENNNFSTSFRSTYDEVISHLNKNNVMLVIIDLECDIVDINFSIFDELLNRKIKCILMVNLLAFTNSMINRMLYTYDDVLIMNKQFINTDFLNEITKFLED